MKEILKRLHNARHFMMELTIRKMIFFSVEEDRVSIILYNDDFKVCYPLGTSQSDSCVLGVGKHSSTVTINIDIYLSSYSV